MKTGLLLSLFAMFFALQLQAQNLGNISGTVTNNEGEPLLQALEER